MFVGLLSALDAGPFLLRVDPDAAPAADAAAGQLVHRALGVLRRVGHERTTAPANGYVAHGLVVHEMATDICVLPH